MTDLVALLDQGERHARRSLLLRRERQLTGLYHLVAPEGGYDRIVTCLWRNDIEKQITILAVKKLSREMGAVAALALAESWMVRLATGEYERRGDKMDPPSQDPRRVEVVTIIATDGQTTRQRLLYIKRDQPGGRIIDLVPDHDIPQGGRFAGRMLDGIISPAGAQNEAEP